MMGKTYAVVLSPCFWVHNSLVQLDFDLFQIRAFTPSPSSDIIARPLALHQGLISQDQSTLIFRQKEGLKLVAGAIKGHVNWLPTLVYAPTILLCLMDGSSFLTSPSSSACFWLPAFSYLPYSPRMFIGASDERDDPPPKGLCLLQTLLIYPAPVLAASATLCYYIEDLRQAWCFWRKPEPYTSIVFHHHTLSTTNYFTSHAQPADSSKPVDESELEDSESIFSMGSRMDLLHETSLDKTEESTMDNDSKGVLVEFLARKKPKMVSVARMRSLRVSLKEMYLPTNQ
ncbi:hypothetical protein D9756_009605 [Leucocoprinus leucothites]|uniref:Uncharacterized protein n=1 Tax=Leucocoprinus leucothites TaxID=201217 RepID=A0A8H5CW56_9AGAR|nr:hypothetical protein D9756_009605 [Leucoagaricus leucothites]